jgi:DNA polymerase bacteriophage-type
MILFVDTETCGERFRDGVDIYVTLGGARPILLQWAVDHGPVTVCEPTDANLTTLRAMVADADTVVFHRAEFDLPILRTVQIHVPMHKVHCTLVQARQHGLFGSLDKLCWLFSIEDGKRKLGTGRELMALFCTPHEEGRYTKLTHPHSWADFCEYARHDVLAMRALYYKMPRWNSDLALSRAGYMAHLKCQDRGFQVDLPLALAVVKSLAANKTRSDAAFAAATEGEITSGTQNQRLLEYVLAEHGVELPDCTASTLERRLADDSLPEEVKELLRMRLAIAKSSTAKYQALIRSAGEDGRVRGAKEFCGAKRTGRFSAKILQTDNLPRPMIPVEQQRLAIACFKAGTDYLLDDKPLAHYASECLRGAVIAAPGHRLLVADYSSVEPRYTAWVSGEAWKLDAFRRYDTHTGPDLYKLSYARCFNVPLERVTKPQRQIGKVIELFCGYGGGVGAFLTGCAAYHVDPQTLLATLPAIPHEAWKDSGGKREWFIEKLKDRLARELPEDLWRVCFCLTRLWRADNPAIADMWTKLEDAFRDVQNEEVAVTGVAVGPQLRVDRQEFWTRIRLPSGRYLCYPDVRVDGQGIHFAGENPYTHKWGRIRTYGGKLLENVSQGGCADLLMESLISASATAGRPVLHIHDEPILEQPIGDGWTVERLIQCMTKGIGWARGLPLAAEGFETDRYYKAL